MTDQPTDKPTGLRRVILDAIRGTEPDHAGMSLDQRTTDELLAIYDQLRPGVLDALGRGE